MKLVSRITQVDMDSDDDPKEIGRIWTDGKKIYFSPEDNEEIRMMAGSTVIGSDSNEIKPSEPLKFVKALATNYRIGTVASEAKVER